MWVDLPVVGGPAVSPAPPQEGTSRQDEPTAPPEALQDVNVLVVEDDAETSEMMSIVLADRGARVRVARDHDHALARLQEEWPDVIVSDIGLPGRDGYDLARAVRALEQPGARRLPMVALTAFARPEDQRKAMDAGFDLHLAKPLKPHALLGAIAQLLRAPAPAAP
jgi:CheY-like chemotaxis protein